MPRQSRIDTTGALHHIIARGIERRNIFEDVQDRYDFLKNLGLILEQTETANKLRASHIVTIRNSINGSANWLKIGGFQLMKWL